MINDIHKQIANMLKKDFKIIEEIDYNEPLIVYGIDSLNYIKVLVEIEELFKIKFDDNILMYNGMTTLNNLSQEVFKLCKHL